jgi:enoyl-CoA hydratase/methylglutaconyl-CoA hydratase
MATSSYDVPVGVVQSGGRRTAPAHRVIEERTVTETEQPTELVHYRVDDHVASLILDSQHNRNALSRQLVGELFAGLDRAEADDDVKVVLIRAEGRTFCSGADLSEASEDGMEKAAGVLVDLQRRIATLTKPVVARVHGNVRAGGIGIVAASDIAVCATDATFAFTEVRLGLTPAAISLSVLPRMTDRAAARTFLTGEVFDGKAAARMGLVTTAVHEDELNVEVDEICADLAKGNPQGLRETKALIGRHLVERIETQGDDLAKLSARLFGSEEAKAAMLAFLNRKK